MVPRLVEVFRDTSAIRGQIVNDRYLQLESQEDQPWCANTMNGNYFMPWEDEDIVVSVLFFTGKTI